MNDVPLVGQQLGQSFPCPKCNDIILVPFPSFEVVNAQKTSMIVWVHEPVKCKCGAEYLGAINGLHPDAIRIGMIALAPKTPVLLS